jgi:type 1 glutamine amidotransferase
MMGMATKVLFVSAGIVHPPLLARIWLGRLFSGLEGFQVLESRSIEALRQMDPSSLHCLVLYMHQKSISKAALEILDAYVSDGGGVLGIHSATASFKKSTAYFKILGGRFTGHGPIERFEIRPCQDQDEIFGTIPPFAVKDELYIHELEPDIRVHFVTERAGEEIPMVWTRRHGQGRVCYVEPGHRTASLRHPALQEILKRGLIWASWREDA